jgi:hypothetical protein
MLIVSSDISVFLIDSLINKMFLVSFFAVDVVVPDFSVTLTNLSFSAVCMSPDKLDATVWETMFGSAKLVLLQ